MPDFGAIGDAIAAKYAPGAMTPPGGLSDVRGASANLPEAIPDTPRVLIFVDEGDLSAGNSTRTGLARYLARFYYAEAGDMERDYDNVLAWLNVLIDVFRTGMQLAGTVAAVRTVGWKVGVLPYAGRSYSGVELRLEIVTTEPWTPTA